MPSVPNDLNIFNDAIEIWFPEEQEIINKCITSYEQEINKIFSDKKDLDKLNIFKDLKRHFEVRFSHILNNITTYFNLTMDNFDFHICENQTDAETYQNQGGSSQPNSIIPKPEMILSNNNGKVNIRLMKNKQFARQDINIDLNKIINVGKNTIGTGKINPEDINFINLLSEINSKLVEKGKSILENVKTKIHNLFQKKENKNLFTNIEGLIIANENYPSILDVEKDAYKNKLEAADRKHTLKFTTSMGEYDREYNLWLEFAKMGECLVIFECDSQQWKGFIINYGNKIDQFSIYKLESKLGEIFGRADIPAEEKATIDNLINENLKVIEINILNLQKEENILYDLYVDEIGKVNNEYKKKIGLIKTKYNNLLEKESDNFKRRNSLEERKYEINEEVEEKESKKESLTFRYNLLCKELKIIIQQMESKKNDQYSTEESIKQFFEKRCMAFEKTHKILAEKEKRERDSEIYRPIKRFIDESIHCGIKFPESYNILWECAVKSEEKKDHVYERVMKVLQDYSCKGDFYINGTISTFFLEYTEKIFNHISNFGRQHRNTVHNFLSSMQKNSQGPTDDKKKEHDFFPPEKLLICLYCLKEYMESHKGINSAGTVINRIYFCVKKLNEKIEQSISNDYRSGGGTEQEKIIKIYYKKMDNLLKYYYEISLNFENNYVIQNDNSQPRNGNGNSP